ncbi:MAG TPA: branched-chain amino acid ABC transporter permease [Anaeromyxobacteraceae bacterium]|nr:branched-chain amino acid ABC transporter permease [Anaeromyxobacteraceae bacterium]
MTGGRTRGLAAAAVALGLVLFPVFFRGPVPLHVMIMTFLFGLLGVAWNIMGGYAGMFSFGQAAFFGIGAYASSWLFTAHGVSPWIGLLAGGVLAALTGAAIGWPCSNLRGHYFAIASIAFAEIVRIHFNNWKLIGAAEGLTIPMKPQGLASFQFHDSKVPYYYLALGLLAVGLLVSRWVSTSRMGYYFRAIKESHDLAMVLGISFVRYRLWAIMLSAFLSAAAGTFYAQYILYLDPESVLILPISVQVVLVAMLGGAGTVLGPAVGAAILVPISEFTRIEMGHKGTGADMMVYGALIWIISVYQPKGVWGFLASLGSRRRHAPAPAAAPEAAP